MAPEDRPEEAVEQSANGQQPEAAEEAPAGASSGRAGKEQRAGAAAYAAAQSAVPPRPEQSAAEGAEEAGPEPVADGEPQSDDDGGMQVQQDLHELATKAEKADEYLALAQRTQADFENYRKRAAREAALAQDRGVAKVAKELLPAIDNLSRALKAMSEEDSQLAEGIKLVHTDLLAALQRVGVEPFSPEGEAFDPQFHEAVAQQPIEGVESGVVAEVFQQGFRLGDSVLRPARVLVAA